MAKHDPKHEQNGYGKSPKRMINLSCLDIMLQKILPWPLWNQGWPPPQVLRLLSSLSLCAVICISEELNKYPPMAPSSCPLPRDPTPTSLSKLPKVIACMPWWPLQILPSEGRGQRSNLSREWLVKCICIRKDESLTNSVPDLGYYPNQDCFFCAFIS